MADRGRLPRVAWCPPRSLNRPASRARDPMSRDRPRLPRPARAPRTSRPGRPSARADRRHSDGGVDGAGPLLGLQSRKPSVFGHASVWRAWNTRDVSLESVSEPRRVARDPERRLAAMSPPEPAGADTEEEPSMLLHRDQLSASPSPDGERLTGLVRTHWMLAVCVVCGHERVHGERRRAICPTCGATLNSFALYRDLHARR